MQRQNTADKVAECSDPRGAQAGEGSQEVDGGRGCGVVDAVKCIQQEFEWQLMLLLKDGGDVLDWGSSGSDTRARILEQVKLREGFVRGTKEKVVESTGGRSHTISGKFKFCITLI